MAQLASGRSTSYPAAIDTKQVFRNATAAAPDSDTRLDSELANDSLDAILAIETALGAMPQGTYASLAARLNAFLPGGGAVSSILAFTNATTLTVLGAVHRLGTSALRYQLYDNASPMQAMQPGSITVNPSTYDVTLTFLTPQSGLLVLSASGPSYVTAFTDSPGFTIPGTVHQLGTAAIGFQAYDSTGPLLLPFSAMLSVDPVTFDVAVAFVPNATGVLLLSAPGPSYTTTFTSQTTVTLPNSTHGLGSKALLPTVYDAAGNAIEAGSFSVDPTTYQAVFRFLTPQSGRVVLHVAGELSGQDFEIRDAGVVDRTGIRMYSKTGTLSLQSGGGNALYLRSKTGTIRVTMDDSGRLGIGTTTPAYQLQLTTDSAAKPATNTWTISSDARLKEVLRPYTDGLDALLQLEPLWYRYNGKGGMPADRQQHIGVLAQAVQAIAPYMVSSYEGRLTPEEAPTDILTFNSHALPFMLLNGMKELHARLVTLEAANAALQAQVTALTPPPEEETLPC